LSLWRRLTGRGELPDGFTGRLEGFERVLASAATSDGHLVITSLGLWVPVAGGYRRIGWHLISNARWDGRALHVTEADEAGTAGEAVLLTDRPASRYPLPAPGHVPQLVHGRVVRSVEASERREVPGGSALFIRRRVPGRDGVQVQVRPDPGTGLDAVRQALG